MIFHHINWWVYPKKNGKKITAIFCHRFQNSPLRSRYISHIATTSWSRWGSVKASPSRCFTRAISKALSTCPESSQVCQKTQICPTKNGTKLSLHHQYLDLPSVQNLCLFTQKTYQKADFLTYMEDPGITYHYLNMPFVFEKLLEREKSWNFYCWCEKSPCQVALNFFQAIFQVLYDLFHGLLHTSQFNKHGLDFAMTLQRLCPEFVNKLNLGKLDTVLRRRVFGILLYLVWNNKPMNPMNAFVISRHHLLCYHCIRLAKRQTLL